MDGSGGCLEGGFAYLVSYMGFWWNFWFLTLKKTELSFLYLMVKKQQSIFTSHFWQASLLVCLRVAVVCVFSFYLVLVKHEEDGPIRNVFKKWVAYLKNIVSDTDRSQITYTHCTENLLYLGNRISWSSVTISLWVGFIQAITFYSLKKHFPDALVLKFHKFRKFMVEDIRPPAWD